MIFVDSNIPMYLVGAPHSNKAHARQLLESAITTGDRLVCSAEVLQEILHRYASIGRRDALQPALDALLGVVDEVFPVDRADVEAAKKILDGISSSSACDALHVAVMRRRDVRRIMSFDTGFDPVPGLSRVPG